MRRGLRSADWLLLVLILGLSLAAFLLDAMTDQRLRPGPRIVVGLLFAIGTALVWLALFYRQDRVEPEPKHLVGTVTLVSALAAGAVAEPLAGLAPIPEGPLRWVVAVLAVGVLRELTKLVSVWLVALPANEIGERADGIVYGTAAGLGYAVAVNIRFVVEAGGADVATGFTWMGAVTLLHAALGGLIGYLLARDQLEPVARWHLPVGLLVAGVVDVAFFEARASLAGAVATPGSTGAFASWLGVGMAVVLALLIGFLLIRAMHREEGVT